MSESGVSDIERLWNWIYRSTQNRLQIKSFKFRVVLCRIRLFPTLISKLKWLGSVLPFTVMSIFNIFRANLTLNPTCTVNPICSANPTCTVNLDPNLRRQFVSFYIEVARKTCTYLRFWSFNFYFSFRNSTRLYNSMLLTVTHIHLFRLHCSLSN